MDGCSSGFWSSHQGFPGKSAMGKPNSPLAPPAASVPLEPLLDGGPPCSTISSLPVAPNNPPIGASAPAGAGGFAPAATVIRHWLSLCSPAWTYLPTYLPLPCTEAHAAVAWHGSSTTNRNRSGLSISFPSAPDVSVGRLLSHASRLVPSSCCEHPSLSLPPPRLPSPALRCPSPQPQAQR